MRYGIGLRQHSGTGLHQNLIACELRDFLRHVGIADPGFGSRQVFGVDADVVDRVLETVLHGTKFGAALRNDADRRLNESDGRLCAGCRFDTDLVDAQFIRLNAAAQAYGDRRVCFETDLEGNAALRTVEQRDAVELQAGCDVVDFFQQLVDFELDLLAVGFGQGAVGSLVGQHVQTLQHRMNFGQRAFSRLNEGDAVLRVADRLIVPADLIAHFLRDGQTCCVVSRAVDPVAGRQLLHHFTHLGVVEPKVAMGVDGAHVGVDEHRHANIILHD